MYVYMLALVATLVGLLYLYFSRTLNYWKDRNIVGPKPLALFGNLKNYVLRREALQTVYKDIYNDFSKEKVVGIYRMTTPALLLRDLDIIKHVLIKDFDMFADRGVEFSKKALGVNMFHADGDEWRVLRHRFTPLFTSGKLKNMLYLITERGDKFIKHVESLQECNPEQPIHKLLQRFTMGSITACAFGVDVDDTMVATLDKMDKLIFTVNYSNELDMLYPGILKKFDGSLFPKIVNKFFLDLGRNVIKQREGQLSNRKDFMDLILELRQQKVIEGSKRHDNENLKPLELTDSVIAAQAFVFYAAGYETSASTMTYLFYELAKRPEIQDKLIAEIDQVLERHNGHITYESLTEMTYLGQVFDETLRKYPVADPLQRNAKVDYKIPGTDITIKKGQTVIISCSGIQHDPQHYPDPDRFDPERFRPENVKNRHSCAYLPFGAGPRNCLGMRFAKLQSEVCIVKILTKFRVEPSANTKTEIKFDPMRLFIFPAGGVYLNLVRRQA